MAEVVAVAQRADDGAVALMVGRLSGTYIAYSKRQRRDGEKRVHTLKIFHSVTSTVR